MSQSTIFGLSSGSGRTGVAVVRLSGPACRTVVRALTGSIPAPRRASLRTLRARAGRDVIDDGIVLFFPGPTSFTGEDVVEFQVHGSPAVIRRLLRELATFENLVPAEPGEFTRRAYLNNRMGLLEVEALGDLLAAETEWQRRSALNGGAALLGVIRGWHERLLTLRSLTEAYIDFSDERDVADQIDSSTEQAAYTLVEDMDSALSRAQYAERLRLGFRVALLGAPNAGKSSLLNALAARDVAITSPLPGTTRDTIEVHLDLDGIPVTLVDTAGVRDSDDPVESEGIARSWRAAGGADLTLWLSAIDSPMKCPKPEFLEVITKADLAGDGFPESLAVSVINNRGIEPLLALLKEHAANGVIGLDMPLLAHERHVAAVRESAGWLRASLQHGPGGLDLRAEDLRLACVCLDRLIGRIEPDEVLGAIFARFCIGK